jgi:hypothetical protein
MGQPMGQPAGQPTGQQAEQPSRQPGRQPSQRPVAPAAAPASEASSAPGNVVSGTGVPLAAAAAMKGVPSVQALRKRIKKGTLKSVRVLHRDSIVVGVELEELARQYPQAFGEEPATEPLRTEPEAQPRARSQQPRAPGEQPDGLEAQRGNPAEEPESPHSASAPQSPVGPDEQPGAPRVEQPEPRRSQELQTVDVAIQGWREAREALEASRREHREEITRTIAAYEGRLQSGSREREQALEFHGTREARAVRWGRALAGTLLFTLAMGLWLTSRAGERLATERFQAGALTEQSQSLTREKVVLEQAIEVQSAELGAALEALDEAEAKASALRTERGALELELEAILAERERAREATRAALRAMGTR